jgi:hypothetical protein
MFYCCTADFFYAGLFFTSVDNFKANELYRDSTSSISKIASQDSFSCPAKSFFPRQASCCS